MSTGTEEHPIQHYKYQSAFLLHDSVLCDNGSSLIVQKLQLIPTELSLVAIASNSPLMAGQQTCETLLSSKWSGSVFTVSGNPYKINKVCLVYRVQV